MIIGKKFAWQHMPRTAGTFTARALQSIPGLEIEFADPEESERGHAAFWERQGPLLDDKLRVMNIRRLPTWIASQARVVAQRQGKTMYSTDVATRALSVDQIVRSGLGDEMLKHFLRDTHVDRWIRLETLDDDIKRLAWELAGVSQITLPTHIPQTLLNYTAKQLRQLYETNPLWAEVELQAYGSLPEFGDYQSSERALGVAAAPIAPVMSGGKKDKPLPPAKAHPGAAPKKPKHNGTHIVIRTGQNTHHFGPFLSLGSAQAFIASNKQTCPGCNYEMQECCDPDNDADDVPASMSEAA